MRVALYARYSDDKQNPLSIADQLALCTRRAEALGWTVVAVFTDAAISGSAVANRPGMNNLLAAAEAGEFDAILVEHQDRMFRNLEQHLAAFNRLKRAGVIISTLTIPHVLLMHVAIEGLMSEMALEVLSDKTKRGMHANAEKGLSIGGRVYGYRSTPGGEMTIEPAEAEHIRTAFALYQQNWSCRDIAEHFNKLAIPSPSGGLWSGSTFSGSRQRGNGIFRCELYVGVKVWNRFLKSKDPSTGKRVQTTVPESEWKRTPVPQLRIVDQDAWDAAQVRQEATSAHRPTEIANRAKPGIFTGLLRCGDCGGNYVVEGRARLRCSTVRNKGRHACANGRTIARATVEDRILRALKERLLSPKAVSAYIRAYHAAWAEAAGDRSARRAPLERKLAETGRAIERLVDAICNGANAAALTTRLQTLEDEKARLAAELEAVGQDDPITLHPRLAEVYAGRVERLQERLADLASGKLSPDDRQAIDAVRAMVSFIEIMPKSHERGAEVEITLHGDLARFLRPGSNAGPQYMSRLVAGGGIEPPTCGL